MKKPFLILLLLAMCLPMFSQSALDKAKRDISKEKGTKESRSSNDYDDYDSSDDYGFLAEFLYWASAGILIGSYDLEDHLHYRLSNYPYFEDDRTGDYTPYLELEDRNNLRLDISNSFLLGDGLNGNHLKLKIRPTHILYLQTDYTELFQRSTDTDGYDHLSLFNFNLGYDRLRFQQLSLGFTLGATYIGNNVQEVGFNYGLSAEYFTSLNLSLSAAIKGSHVNETPVDQLELALRYHFNRFYASVGTDFIRLGSPVFQFTTFGIGVYL